MSSNANDIAEDIITLDFVASKYLLGRLDILSNLENILENDIDSSRIIQKYNTLSNLISMGQPGPGWMEISSPIYFWSILLASSNAREDLVIVHASVSESNRILNKIEKIQIPLIIEKLDKIISLIETVSLTVNSLEVTISEIIVSNLSMFSDILQRIESYLKNDITSILMDIVSKLDNIVQTISYNVKSLFEENLEKFSEDTSEKTSLKIVGQSYYKWDSENIYAPTLVFLLDENIPELTRRRTRISIKLPFTRETLPTDILEILQRKITQIPLLEYEKGNIRSTFVHPTRKWRTTVFVKNKRDSRRILRYVSDIGGFEFLPEGLSYTQGRIPLRFTNITEAIPGVTLRERTNAGEYKVHLTRIVLLLSNSDSPVIVWKETV